MMHNTNFDTPDYKTITVGKLIQILQTLPPDWEIWTNAVKNLSLGDGKEIQGYIDIAEEVWNPA